MQVQVPVSLLLCMIACRDTTVHAHCSLDRVSSTLAAAAPGFTFPDNSKVDVQFLDSHSYCFTVNSIVYTCYSAAGDDMLILHLLK